MSINLPIEYLTGEKFSNSLRVDIRSSDPLIDRIEWLARRADGAAVIHFGFADHIGLIEAKRAQGRWLHARLMERATDCVGLDLNAEAVDHIKAANPAMECYRFDLYNDDLPASVRDRKWDFIVLGEILEHVDDPVGFLKLINAQFAGCCDKLVVTVPNALSAENILLAFKDIEYINSDHRFWFSPFTLGKVITRAGLEIEDIILVASNLAGLKGVKRLLSRFRPSMGDTLIATIKLDELAS